MFRVVTVLISIMCFGAAAGVKLHELAGVGCLEWILAGLILMVGARNVDQYRRGAK